MLRALTIVISILLHGTMLIPLMDMSPGGRSFEVGTGDDELRIEQGVALEGISTIGNDAETIVATEVEQVKASRFAEEIQEVKVEEPPPTETPVEELKPEEPPELADVITTTATSPEPDPVPVETPPPVEEVKPPEEIKELKPQPRQIASIEQVAQVEIQEAQSASAKQSGGKASISTAYLGSLRDRINKVKIKPRSLKQGIAIVRFKISSDGRLLSSEISRSSGSKRLDSAALDAIDRAAPFPAFPEGIGIKSMAVTQRFRFSTR
ncbi:MAG: energy transducer TonB family protein [Hyphomicrobiaceae bacterium]